jgi:hypothetical protein
MNGQKYNNLTETAVTKFFSGPYSPTLKLVALPRVRIREETKGKSEKYTDQLFFLHWLRKKHVKKILKLIVDDSCKPHNDEDIEKVLLGASAPVSSFDVEILDWRKTDLCPMTIKTAAPHVRELHLQWSGNNSVLRGWSEPQGLPSIRSLEAIYLRYRLVRNSFFFCFLEQLEWKS